MSEEPTKEILTKPSKAELLLMLKDMIKSTEELPPHVMHSFCTHYDLMSLQLLVFALFSDD